MTGKVGIAQIDSTSGDFEKNSKKITEYIRHAEEEKLDVVIFPKFALTGCMMDDVFERHPHLVDENLKWLDGLAKITGNTAVIIDFTDSDKNQTIAILKNGKIDKILNGNDIYTIGRTKFGITNSEDIISAISELQSKGADIAVILASSPSRNGKEHILNSLISNAAESNKIPIILVNRVGATECLSFDGGSICFNQHGEIVKKAKLFGEDFLTVNPYERGKKPEVVKEEEYFSLDYESDLERTYKAIIQGIRSYFATCGLKRAVIGLSGGLDSTVCAVLLADALGKENVVGISMPSKITSKESKSDAEELANNLGIHFTEMSIKPMVETTSECLENLFKNVQTGWNDRYTKSYTQDNIQARARAIYLFGVSNEFPSCIPIATSDKSEAYMGYATINGDMSGGFAPIADVTKTKLFALARWMNKNRAEKNAIPESIILKKPGAELAINPETGESLKAEEALMPYEFLDEIIWRIENKHESYKIMLDSEFLYEKEHKISREQKAEWLDKFYSRMSKALCKWGLMPVSLIIDSHSINGYEYSQPVTSCGINYKEKSREEISKILCNFVK